MRVHYINCFNVGDPAAPPLSDALDAWQSDSRHLVRSDAVDGNQLQLKRALSGRDAICSPEGERGASRTF